MTLITQQGWGALPSGDLWPEVEKDSGDGVSVLCTVLPRRLKPCGLLPCAITVSTALPAWLPSHTAFPAWPGLLCHGQTWQTQLISVAPALPSLFFSHHMSLRDIPHPGSHCFLIIDFPQVKGIWLASLLLYDVNSWTVFLIFVICTTCNRIPF